MVEDTGKTPGADAVKPVDAPEPIEIKEDPQSVPATIRMGRRTIGMSVLDRWRIDDEWWREYPVSRLYYDVLLISGQRFVVYKDLVDGRWYRQAYSY